MYKQLKNEVVTLQLKRFRLDQEYCPNSALSYGFGDSTHLGEGVRGLGAVETFLNDVEFYNSLI